MAVQKYIDQADRSPQSGVAAEAVKAGELVFDNAGSVRRVEFADGELDGLALYDPEFMAAEDEDAVADEAVEVGDLLRYSPQEDAARLYVRTLEESTAGVTAAPSIGHEDVVGFVDGSDANAPSAEGRIVEEGYTNDEDDDTTTTTFSRANNNFLAIGEAYRPAKQSGDSVTDFDVPIRVELYGSVEA